MRFRQLDSIVELEAGTSITAQRTVSQQDSYFLDHFPEFPVLPGVLTLEAMFQACDWLVRKTDGFCRSVVALREVRNLKFSGMVRPGQVLVVGAEVKKLDSESATFVARAKVDDVVVASGRIVLERYDLAERRPTRAATDRYLRENKRRQFQVLDPNSADHRPVVPTHYRWMWIDRFTEFVSGQRAVAVKTVSITDEPLDLYMPGFPVMPCSLIVEGIAQIGGALVGQLRDFEDRVMLAKAGRVVMHREAVPGDRMTYSAEIVNVEPEGARVRATSHIDDELQAEVELLFAYLGEEVAAEALIAPADLIVMLRLYGLYDVGKTASGEPIAVPQRLLDAEQGMYR